MTANVELLPREVEIDLVDRLLQDCDEGSCVNRTRCPDRRREDTNGVRETLE